MDLLVQLAQRNVHRADAVAFTTVHAATGYVEGPGNMEYRVLREVGPLGDQHRLHLVKYTDLAGADAAYITAGVTTQAAAELFVPVCALIFGSQFLQFLHLSKSFLIVLDRQLFADGDV